MEPNKSIFVGRQPIVDDRQHVVAYELLFRASASAQGAVYDEQQKASIRVIANIFTTLGVNAVLGDCRGFFNVTHQVLMSDVMEALPRDRVVVEILEDVEPCPEILQRCQALRAAGFTLALDDYILGDPREALLGCVDVVKVDLPLVQGRDLKKLVRRLRRQKLQLLAEKVETREEFEVCRKLGFDLYQGYFFARPVVLEGTSLDSGRLALLELLQLLYADADTRPIVETLKHSVSLGVNLLQLVNSAALATRNKIGRIEDAVNYLGRSQLRRWVSILLFADDDQGGVRSPLLQTAAHRGRLMELVLRLTMDVDASGPQCERAFLAGMLSLVDVLLGRSMEEVMDDLNVEDEIRQALVKRDGVLGRLLLLVEDVERADLPGIESHLGEFGLSLHDLQQAEHESYAWVHQLANDSGSGEG